MPSNGPEPSRGKRSVATRLLVAVLMASWLVGGVDGLFVATPSSRPLVVLFAVMLSSIIGVAVGAVLWLAVTVLSRLPRLAPLLARVDEPAKPLPRQVVLHVYGYAISVIAIVAATAGVAKVAYPLLFDLQETELATVLAGAGVVLVAAGALVVMPALTSLVARVLERLDQEEKLSRPPAWLLAALVVVPLFMGTIALLRDYGPMLDEGRDVLAAILLLAATVQLLLVRRGAWLAQRWVALAAVVLAPLSATVGVLAYSPTAADAERAVLASLGARLVRRASDVDGDGASPFLEGEDCAPFDHTRRPGVMDIPGNQKDEDCDGADAKLAVVTSRARQKARYADVLTKDQIRKYNIVWVVIDAVRADHVPTLGYDKPTMPFIDELAKESWLFSRAYSQSSATALSFPSMLSGANPAMLKWQRTRKRPDVVDTELMLAERLKALGYDTALFMTEYTSTRFKGLQQGFDHVGVLALDKATKRQWKERRGAIATAQAIDYLANAAPGPKPQKPLFMVVYYPDPHAPYVRHKDIDSSAFSTDAVGDYDTELRFADAHLKVFIEQLKARPGVWEDTILVVLSDHGEEFEEHGGKRHALTCHVESVHVLLLVRIPGQKPQRIDARVGLVDVAPTVLELVGAPRGGGIISGQSLLIPGLTPEAVDPQRPLFCSVVSQKKKQKPFLRRSVRIGDLALLEDVHNGSYALYDTAADKGELNDLSQSPEYAQTVAVFRKLLKTNLGGNLTDFAK